MRVLQFLVLVVFLKSLIDDFWGFDCLVSPLHEQLGDFETGGALTLEMRCWLEDESVTLIVGPEWGSDNNRIFFNEWKMELHLLINLKLVYLFGLLRGEILLGGHCVDRWDLKHQQRKQLEIPRLGDLFFQKKKQCVDIQSFLWVAVLWVVDTVDPT